MKIKILFIFYLSYNILHFSPLYPQNKEYPILKELIDTPIAGSLRKGTFDVGLRMYPEGGVLSEMSIGLMNRVMASVYYGGENFIGEGEVNWNPQIGFEMRIRIIEESFAFPAVSIGFNSQGYGGYRKTLKRYTYKSKGFYTVVSRNYYLLGNLGLHIGANKSLEKEDKDKDINIFLGFDKSFPGGLELLAEYDFAFNDNENEDLSFGKGNGYLNSALKWSVTGGFSVTFIFRNIARNKKFTSGVGREIKISYVRNF